MIIDNRLSNIPNVDADKAMQSLYKLIENAITKGVSLDAIPTIMLWGPPGVGKSSIVKQVCEKVEKEAKKKVTLTDIRLLLFSPVDLRGVPVADASHTFTKWLMPKIFDLSEADDVINVIFLDEISAAPQSVQAAAYQICLDHRIGEHILPQNTIVVAAGNRTTDHSVAYKMPTALANRMLHFNIETNVSVWMKWGVNNNIDERVLGYLSFDGSKLIEEPDNNSLAYPTPRSWEFVSTILKTTGDSVVKAHDYISAAVGVDTAFAFERWCEVFQNLPDTKDIFLGVCRVKPKNHDAVFATISSMTTYVAQHKDSITTSELEKAFIYVKGFNADYVMMFYDNIRHIDGIELKLLKCNAVKEWINRS